jgi:hypothetical protein
MSAALVFAGCSESGDNGIVQWETLSVRVEAGQTKYYSLKTGKEVSDPTSTAWDIAFERGSGMGAVARTIYTNSGASAAAAGSSGAGGVTFGGSTNFDSVTAITGDWRTGGEYGEFKTDVKKWVSASTDQNDGVERRLNVMTYLGYPVGDGASQATSYAARNIAPPFDDTTKAYDYDKKQFYTSGNMPPKYSLTNEVYIIKHGDGAGYSKIQIIEYSSTTSPSADNYTIKYQNS